MNREKLNDEELKSQMATLSDWTVEGGKLTKRFEFPDFAESLTFVNKAGELAETADHHPDITFGWGYAEFAITTHDRGGITPLDIDLAKKIDEIN